MLLLPLLCAGDGCDFYCEIEYDYKCFGEPSECHICGDGDLDPGQECDDENVIDECVLPCRLSPRPALTRFVLGVLNIAATAAPTARLTRDGLASRSRASALRFAAIASSWATKNATIAIRTTGYAAFSAHAAVWCGASLSLSVS